MTRNQARKKDTGEAGNRGEFGTTARGESEVEVAAAGPRRDHLMTAPPREFDAELAAHYKQLFGLQERERWRLDALHFAAGDDKVRGQWRMSDQEAVDKAQETPNASRVGDTLNEYRQASAQVEESRSVIGEYEQAFDERGGWNRAFLSTSKDGHVHSSRYCGSLRPTTRLQWLTEYSDRDESKIVADAGWRACTFCYPSAPVGDERSLPTRMFSDEEREQQAKAAEREKRKQAAAAKKAAKSVTGTGEPLIFPSIRLSNGKKYAPYPVETERHAEEAWERGLWSMRGARSGYQYENPDDARARAAADLAQRVEIARALAKKHGTTALEQKRRLDQKVGSGLPHDDEESYL